MAERPARAEAERRVGRVLRLLRAARGSARCGSRIASVRCASTSKPFVRAPHCDARSDRPRTPAPECPRPRSARKRRAMRAARRKRGRARPRSSRFVRRSQESARCAPASRLADLHVVEQLARDRCAGLRRSAAPARRLRSRARSRPDRRARRRARERASLAARVLRALQLQLEQLLHHVELAELPVDAARFAQRFDQRRVQLEGILEVLERLHALQELPVQHPPESQVQIGFGDRHRARSQGLARALRRCPASRGGLPGFSDAALDPCSLGQPRMAADAATTLSG